MMSPELFDPADRSSYLLWQTAHLAGRQLTTALEPFDLTAAQFGALIHTGREPGISAAELARRVNLAPQSIQTALRPLLEREWVQRRPHPVHQRVLGNFLTPEGLMVAGQASSAVTSADARLVASLNDSEVSDLKDFLLRVLLSLNPTALDRSSLRQAGEADLGNA
ncbi:MarR family transcriptional regulator [Nakamurella sp. A5-74]|uniref:MarR family transcriptional regulator n=1 Tax=Nakamurella sp. A5-74 TaxID=3158264 RepID=A0AAU8DJG8_9ACTN